jgi:hypothetical protein
MQKKKVWQYKCDFCGKKNYSAGHMKSHEKHCTMNPDRSCRMCKYAEDVSDPKKAISIMPDPNYVGCNEIPEFGIPDNGHMILLNEDELKEILKDVIEICGYCPACILSVLRLKGIHPNDIGFDYKKEVAILWRDSEKEFE